MQRLLVAAACLAVALAAAPSAQSDLDGMMRRVLERRDQNWKKLQQYTLEERETLQITALAVMRLYGFEREYLWFPREGFFIRSPVKADGVRVSEDKRRQAEDRWLLRSRNREAQSAQPAKEEAEEDVADIIRQSFEPAFIESANFLKFKFEEGQYALVGPERMLDRNVLKIEYYPKRLFGEQLSKVSVVTLWVDPAEHQVLRYEFRNIELDFLPVRWLVRVDGMRATMQMSEPFPSVWLPASLSARFRARTAAGPFEGRYEVIFTNYRLPEASGRVVQ